MAQLNENFDPTKYWRAFPNEPMHFDRFATIPKDIILEFAYRGLPFYFQ